MRKGWPIWQRAQARSRPEGSFASTSADSCRRSVPRCPRAQPVRATREQQSATSDEAPTFVPSFNAAAKTRLLARPAPPDQTTLCVLRASVAPFRVCVTVPEPLSDAPPLPPAFRRTLLLLTVAALLVRVAGLLLEPSVGPVADERTWVDWARHLCSEKVHFSPLRTRMIFHPPLYPYFLASALALTGTLEAAKWA